MPPEAAFHGEDGAEQRHAAKPGTGELGAEAIDDVDEGHARVPAKLGFADMWCDGRQHGCLGAGSGHALDETCKIGGEIVEPAGTDQVLAVLDVGMGHDQVGRDAACFAGGGDLLVVVDGGADAEATYDPHCHHGQVVGKLRFQTPASSGRASALRAMAKRRGVSTSNQPRRGLQRVITSI